MLLILLALHNTSKQSFTDYNTSSAMPDITPLHIPAQPWSSRPKRYADVREFMARNHTDSGVLDTFLLVYSFARHAEHFPTYDKSMLAVYTVDSPKPGHTWLKIYHDTLGMVAQVELCRLLDKFVQTFAENDIAINPDPSPY